MSKVQVMIVDDSAVVRALLEYVIGRDPRLEVCASAASAEEAIRMLEKITPGVIAMDIRLPGMNGLDATRWIMRESPIPIVVATTFEAGKWNSTPMEALRAGALTVLEKPVGSTHASYEAFAERLCTQLFIMSQVIVVKQHGKRELPAPSHAIHPAAMSGRARFKMLGIVCSTGGPGALVQLLGGLGPGFPLPILLVQHMTESFLGGFVSWLGAVSPLPATIVRDGCLPAAGTVHLAPVGCHMRLESGLLRLDTGDPVCFQRPSGTVLFQSMAQDLKARTLGVLLTGMGEDGASGLLDIRRAGGYTIAEDASTAVVYGMPGSAVRMGAVRESLPLASIAPRILELALSRELEP